MQKLATEVALLSRCVRREMLPLWAFLVAGRAGVFRRGFVFEGSPRASEGHERASSGAPFWDIACELFSSTRISRNIHDRYGRPGKGNDKGAVEGLV